MRLYRCSTAHVHAQYCACTDAYWRPVRVRTHTCRSPPPPYRARAPPALLQAYSTAYSTPTPGLRSNFCAHASLYTRAAAGRHPAQTTRPGSRRGAPARLRTVPLAVKDTLWSNLPPIDIYYYIGHVGGGLLQTRGGPAGRGGGLSGGVGGGRAGRYSAWGGGWSTEDPHTEHRCPLDRYL